MEELINMLNSIYPLGVELEKHLLSILQCRQLKEGEYLLKAGRTCESVYFVSKGLLRSYYINKRNKEINLWFMGQGDVVYSIRSFINQTPSKEFIQALQDTTVYYISYKELENTFTQHFTFNFHGRVLTQKYYALGAERDEITRMPDAIDRYNYLVAHFPHLMNVVQDKHLATFIRMTPVTLSRLRSQGLKKKK